jgi:hypothetical protein
MATTGYYLRHNAVRAEDGTLVCGDQWSLIRVDSSYKDELLADGLSEAEATALYWRKLEELVASRASGGDRPPEANATGVTVEHNARRPPRQLALKL